MLDKLDVWISHCPKHCQHCFNIYATCCCPVENQKDCTSQQIQLLNRLKKNMPKDQAMMVENSPYNRALYECLSVLEAELKKLEGKNG